MAENIILPPDSKAIPLQLGMYTIIDSDIYQEICGFYWGVHYDKNGNFYVRRQEGTHPNKKNILLSRWIMNAPEHLQVDHINGNTLDNRRCNLRISSNSQNMHNRLKRAHCSSIHKGVYWNKAINKWRVCISTNKQRMHIGYFLNETEAALAYNEAALKYHGEFARLNAI